MKDFWHGELATYGPLSVLRIPANGGRGRRRQSMTGSTRSYAVVLWILTALFFLRVIGQALVAFGGVAFLPAMSAWQSGLLPYPLLVSIQVFILAIQVKVGLDFSRTQGPFVQPRPRMGRALRQFSVVYALAMFARLVVTRSHPIPVVFHWVLATYLFTLGHFHTRRGNHGQA